MMMNLKHESIFEKMIDAALIYTAIAALFILPLLIPYSYFPVSKFYSEILAVGLSSLIGVLSIIRAKRIEISSIGIATASFCVLLVLQIFVLPIRLPGINIAVASEFLAATFLSIGITSFINGNEYKQRQLVLVVTYCIFISALIQAIFGLLQYTGIGSNFSGVMLYIDTQAINVFGNIGQKNDYVDFLSMGVFALSYLYFIKRIRLITYILNSAFFITIISITTSRTSFVYFILALAITLIFMFAHRKKHENKLINKKILLLIISLFIGLVVVEAALPKVLQFLTARDDITSGLYRFNDASIGQSTYRRFYEWYKDIVIFLNHPFFGIGWYQYPKEAIDLMLKDQRFWYIPANSALYTHSHNSPLNILAETGFIGFFIIFIYGFIYTVFNMFKNFNNHATLFVVFILLTMFGQSFFQYPLWYAYFLMYFILLLSINKPTFSFNNSKAITGGFVVIFTGFMYFCVINYQTYMQVVKYTTSPQNAVEYNDNVRGLQWIIDNNPLWAFPALMIIDDYIRPGSPQINEILSVADQLKYIDMLGNELPYPGAIFKQIIMHKMVGDNTASNYYAELLAHGFPYFKDKFADQLESASPNFADEVKTIRSFKYEDKSIFANKFKNK
jgi:O-antigen ligase